MNMMLIAPAIGVFSGYCMTAVFIVQSNWRTSIIVIAVFSGLNSLIIGLMPAHYMELRLVRKAIEKEDRKGLSRKTSFSDLSEIMEQGVFQRLITNYPFIFLVLTLACY
jgi:small-conductance mechanosensitive channel